MISMHISYILKESCLKSIDCEICLILAIKTIDVVYYSQRQIWQKFQHFLENFYCSNVLNVFQKNGQKLLFK